MKKLRFIGPWLYVPTICFIAACALYRLEHRLPQDIGVWYDQHYLLLDTSAPRWISEGRITEREIFLRISHAKQREFISLFWEMREGGAEDAFNERMEFANSEFDDEGIDGWRTERGRTVLTCGIPNLAEYSNCADEPRMEGDEEWRAYGDEQFCMTWYYQWGWHGLFPVRFHYDKGRVWRRVVTWEGDIRLFEEDALRIFSPTADGWDLWAMILTEEE